jgi:TPR repeat protein
LDGKRLSSRYQSTVFVPDCLGAAGSLLRSWRLEEGLEECLKVAEKGGVEESATAAWMLLIGVTGIRDLAKAESLAESAVAGGSSYGKYASAWIMFEKDDLDTCFHRMSESAEAGFVPAIMDRGRFHASGIGTPRNLKKAESDLRTASRCGHRMATVFLYQMMSAGKSGWLKSWFAGISIPIIKRYAAWQTTRHYFDEIGLIYNPMHIQRD